MKKFLLLVFVCFQAVAQDRALTVELSGKLAPGFELTKNTPIWVMTYPDMPEWLIGTPEATTRLLKQLRFSVVDRHEDTIFYVGAQLTAVDQTTINGEEATVYEWAMYVLDRDEGLMLWVGSATGTYEAFREHSFEIAAHLHFMFGQEFRRTLTSE